MLQELLTLFRQSHGVPLSADLISRQMSLPPAVVEQMLHTLVRRGRLVMVDDGCTGCPACPLKPVCAGAPAVVQTGYRLAV